MRNTKDIFTKKQYHVGETVKWSVGGRKNAITAESKGISIKGHIGTWYVIDSGFHNGVEVFLLEHEKHGEDAASIIVTAQGSIILEDVQNGLDDLEI